MIPTKMADLHDLVAAERFLAAEARIAATFGRIEEAVAPLLRSMRATGRVTYATDPERGAILGHAFPRPPYAPSAAAEWFVAWRIRLPDGGAGWDRADPPLPRGVHAVVALGAEGGHGLRSLPSAVGAPPRGWSVLDGEAAAQGEDAAAPWCMDQSCGRSAPRPRPRSRDADVLRASEFEHAVQHVRRDRHLGRLSRVGL